MLSEHGPSFQLLAKHVRAAQSGSSSSGVVVAKAYRLLASHLAAAHAPLEQASLKANRQMDRRNSNDVDSAESPEGQAVPSVVSDEGNGGSGRWRKLYWSGPTAAQASLLARGFGSGAAPQGGVVCLHSDPALALALHGKASLGDASVYSNGQKGLGALGAAVAVTCAFDDGSNEGGLKQGPVLKQRPLSEESLMALAESTTADGAQGSDILEVRYPTSGGGSKGGVVVLVPVSALVSEQVTTRLLPETHLLLASGYLAQDPKRIEAALDDLSQRGAPLFPGESSAGSSETLLSELEAAVEDEVSS